MNSCQCCGAKKDEREILNFGEQPLSIQYLANKEEAFTTWPLILHMCKKCEFCYIKNPVPADVLYSNTYLGTSENPAGHLQELTKEILIHLRHIKNPFILEIGSNDGYLLKQLSEKMNCRVLGVEPALSCALSAREQGISVINAFFEGHIVEEILRSYGYPDIVICRNVIEHVENPLEFISNLSALLKDATSLLLELPHFDIIKKYGYYMNIMEQHINYFSYSNIKTILGRVGLKVISSKLMPYGGSARVLYCSKSFEDDAIDETYECSMDEFVAQCHLSMEALVQELRRLSEQGKTIAVFGVGTRGLSIINIAKIAPFIDFAIDDHPQKIGKYCPGSLLEILPSKILLSNNPPDYCLLLPMADKITERKVMQKFNQYLLNGGHFIEVLPGDYKKPEAFLRTISPPTMIYTPSRD